MPSNLTDNPAAFTSPVVVPTDGDSANAASVIALAQPLANRTAFLNAQNTLNLASITALQSTVNTTGVSRILRVTNAAALTAIASPANQSFALVDGFGLYQYLSASVLAVDNLLVINGPGGVGRWLHELQAVANQSLGFPVIGAAGGAAGKLPLSIIPTIVVANQLVALLQVATNSFSTVSTPYVDITGATLAVPSCQVGDKLRITWSGGPLSNSIAGSGTGFLGAVVDGGVTSQQNATAWYSPIANAASVPHVIHFLWSVGTAGTVTVKAQLAAITSGTATSLYQTIIVEQFRP
jgi:hypothetical protein